MTEYYSLQDMMMPDTFEEYSSKKDFYDYMRNWDLLWIFEEALDDQKKILDDIEDLRKQNRSNVIGGVLFGVALGVGVTIGVRKLVEKIKSRMDDERD